MAKYHAKIDFYKNAALSFDMLDKDATGEAGSIKDFKKMLVDHCRAWGYDFKIKSIERIEG